MTTTAPMDLKLEVAFLGVTDVDRAKAFYVDGLGFVADQDRRVSDDLRFVQLTPPGSACSIAFGEGITEMAPGVQRGLMLVAEDVTALREELLGRGVEVSDVDVQPWGSFLSLADPDGNTWAIQQLPDRTG